MCSRPLGSLAARGGLLAVLVCNGCTDEADARAQLVVVEQLADPAVSPAAAIDTLRIEVPDEQAQVIDSRTLLVPGVASWPVSFGSVSPEGGRVLLRLRAYRAAFAALGSVTGEVEPLSEITVDRLVELEPPAEGVRAAHVLLDSSCLGVAPTWGEPWQTCIAADALSVLPTEGVRYADQAEVVSAVGTSPGARELPCQGQQRGKCIPGGFSVLGDEALATVETPLILPPVPLRPVLLSPFWMDETEFTVGEFEQLVTAGLVQERPVLWREDIPVRDECTWRSHKPHYELLPVNCVDHNLARDVCAALNRRLPTEAEWEFAAANGPAETIFPWGDDDDACAYAHVGRGHNGVVVQNTQCVDELGVPAGLVAGGSEADETQLGIRNFAGSVAEWVEDAYLSFTDPCWSSARPLLDPICPIDTGLEQRKSVRGAAWLYVPGLTRSIQRNGIERFRAGHEVGLRCAVSLGP